jgi:hypothetical protein
MGETAIDRHTPTEASVLSATREVTHPRRVLEHARSRSRCRAKRATGQWIGRPLSDRGDSV